MEQLNKIFKALGVPSEWPISLRDLPMLNAIELAPSQTRALLDRFPFLNVTGLRMLTSLLNYDPDERWTANEALQSSYFQEKPLPTPGSEMKRFA